MITASLGTAAATSDRSRVVAWGLIVAMAATTLGWTLATAGDSTPPPAWAQLPPPAALARAFDAKPVAIGAQVAPACIPVAAWSGADEALFGPSGLVVAFDGPGTFEQGAGVGLTPGPLRDVSTLQIGNEQDMEAVWMLPKGWAAVVVWQVPAADSTAVASRLAALSGVAGKPVVLAARSIGTGGPKGDPCPT